MLCLCLVYVITNFLLVQCPPLVRYSGKFSWGPNFVLFILSLSEWKFNTWNVRYDGRVFLCKMDRTKIKHTNQLEIAQNEIWTPRKFPAIRYMATLLSFIVVLLSRLAFIFAFSCYVAVPLHCFHFAWKNHFRTKNIWDTPTMQKKTTTTTQSLWPYS